MRHVRSWHTVLCTRANGGIRHLALSPHSLLRATSHLAVLCANLSLSLFPLPFIRPVLLFLPSPSSPPFHPSLLLFLFLLFFPFRYSFPSPLDFPCLAEERRVKETANIGVIGIHLPSLPLLSHIPPSLLPLSPSPILYSPPPPQFFIPLPLPPSPRRREALTSPLDVTCLINLYSRSVVDSGASNGDN